MGGHSGSTSTSIREIFIANLGEEHEYLNASKAALITARADEIMLKNTNGKDP